MADPITVTDLTQAGRLQAPDPNQPRVFVTYNADFSSPSDVTLDFTIINQQQVFGVPRAMFIDNGSNESEVEVSVSGTDQYFTVPPYAQGVFKIDAQLQSRLNFVTVGGATDKVTITIYNWEVSPSVWYRFGAFNKDVPIKVQGTQPTGTDMDTAADNNPVLTAGVQSDGTLTRLLVDATGRLLVVGSAAGNDVYGPDAEGSPPNFPPVLMAGKDNTGDVRTIAVDTSGNVQVEIVGGLATAGLATEAKQDDIIDIITRPSGSAITSVPDAAADTLILAANALRKGATVYNDSTEILYLTLDNTAASLTNFTTKMQPDSYYEVPFGYSGEIRGIWAANAAGNARVTEIV